MLLESRINATGHFEFKIPAQCKFEVEVSSFFFNKISKVIRFAFV